MKQQFSPVFLSSSNYSSSKMDHPLAALLSCVILLAAVTLHFYALGAKADPALLAYDESASWRDVPVHSFPALASASEVLFSNMDSSALNSFDATGTIQSTSAGLSPTSRPGFGLGSAPASSTGMEAALLVLSFGQ